MGWERKRGKLHELNRLLRGATDTTFMPIAGCAPHVPTDVRYVITLDADTKLPRDAALRLIGKMAHPLNRPKFDDVKQRVVDGYAILQPRVTPSLSIRSEEHTSALQSLMRTSYAVFCMKEKMTDRSHARQDKRGTASET